MVDTFKAQTLEETLSLLESGEFTVLAGGTDLMVKKHSWSGTLPRFDKPPLFVAELPELQSVKSERGVLSVGAAVRLADILTDDTVPEILKQAVSSMASPAIRNMGTLGGNLCNASPAGDTLPVLYALGTGVLLKSAHGERELPVEKFILGPGKTALQSGELLVSVRVPLNAYDFTYYKKVGARKADAISKLSFAGLAETEQGILKNIRIAVGAVGPTVVRLPEAERCLVGTPLKKLHPEQVCALYADSVRPIDDQRSSAVYRKTVAMNLIRHFIEELSRFSPNGKPE